MSPKPVFRRIQQAAAILVFAGAGFLVGGPLMSPVVVITVASGINALLVRRLRDKRDLARHLKAALLAFFAAEACCFVGTYLFWREVFLLIHDGFHVLAGYFVFLEFLSSSLNPDLGRVCAGPGCPAAGGSKRQWCPPRSVATVVFWAGGLGIPFLVFLWILDTRYAFLGLPGGMTPLARTISLAVFPLLAAPIVLPGWFRWAVLGRAPKKSGLAMLAVALALVSYAFFQLMICTVRESLAVFTEEFFEFFPMVLVFALLVPVLIRDGSSAGATNRSNY